MSSPHHVGIHQFIAAQADKVLSELVPMAGLVDAAIRDANEALGQARLSDCRQVLHEDTGEDLCPAKLRALLIVAAIELARLGWTPDDHPDANVDPDEQLPAIAPEVPWRAEQ